MAPTLAPDLISLATAAAALLGIVGLVLLIGRLARTRLAGLGLRRAPGPAGRLKLADTLAIGPGRRLHLLECDGQTVLLLTGGSADLMLPLGPSRPAP